MGTCCGPNACGPGYGGRRYYTKEERARELEAYADELARELAAVKERLAEIQA